MNIRCDLLGKIPKIGDIIAYNPPRIKGIKLAYITGFAKSGLPTSLLLEDLEEDEGNNYEEKSINYLKDYESTYKGETPKTGFVIVESNIQYQIY